MIMMRDFLKYFLFFQQKMNNRMNNFISHIFKNDYKHIETDNIKKLYNCDFEVLIYKSLSSKKINTIVIDKRASKDVVYNTLEIAEKALT